MSSKTDEGSPPTKRSGLWENYGWCVFLLLPPLLAVPVWVLLFPESYQRALDFVCDAILTIIVAFAAMILNWLVLRNYKTVRPVLVIIAVVLLAVAVIMGWNMIALYTFAGTTAITIFGWEYSLRPSFYGGITICVALLVSAVGIMVGRSHGNNTTP